MGGHFVKYVYHFDVDGDVDAPNMAPIGLKLCQDAFQTILDISLFDAPNNKKSFFANFDRPFTS